MVPTGSDAALGEHLAMSGEVFQLCCLGRGGGNDPGPADLQGVEPRAAVKQTAYRTQDSPYNKESSVRFKMSVVSQWKHPELD